MKSEIQRIEIPKMKFEIQRNKNFENSKKGNFKKNQNGKWEIQKILNLKFKETGNFKSISQIC